MYETGGTTRNFYDPKQETSKINHSENKVKLNNENNSKNTNNEIT